MHIWQKVVEKKMKYIKVNIEFLPPKIWFCFDSGTWFRETAWSCQRLFFKVHFFFFLVLLAEITSKC